jgi:hypothetical protein
MGTGMFYDPGLSVLLVSRTVALIFAELTTGVPDGEELISFSGLAKEASTTIVTMMMNISPFITFPF